MSDTAILARANIKIKTLAALAAIVAAVALPQLFHFAGAALGLGTGLGQTYLPMHLPVLLVGLLAGPLVGLAVGILSPVFSYALSGMPAAAMLPFMMVELAGYGLAAGLLCRSKLPVLVKVLLIQVAGRAVRAGAILVAVYGLGSQGALVATIWTSIVAGFPGLVLQWALIPLVMVWVARRERDSDYE